MKPTKGTIGLAVRSVEEGCSEYAFAYSDNTFQGCPGPPVCPTLDITVTALRKVIRSATEAVEKARKVALDKEDRPVHKSCLDTSWSLINPSWGTWK